MKKGKLKLVFSMIMIISVIFSCTATAFAVVYTTTEVERVANVPTVNGRENVENCSIISGLGIGKTRNSMFVVKSGGQEKTAAFYYYPNISKPTNYKVFSLECAGHANAMAVTSHYVYVTGWVKEDKNNGVVRQEGNDYNNWVLKIPRSVIASTADGGTIKEDNILTTDVDGFTILYPMVKNTDSKTKDSEPYVKYKKDITAITRYTSDSSFIINYNKLKSTEGEYFAYTTAKLKTYNGKQMLLLSESVDDIFLIKNNMDNKCPTKQDICYNENSGFFAPQWYGKDTMNDGKTVNEYCNKTKSVILWADIVNGTYTYKAIDENKYKYYTPDKINVNMTNKKGCGVKMYSLFEIESIDFTEDDTMLFSANVAYTEDYINAYRAANDKKSPSEYDGVFKLTYNGENFIL